MSNVLVIEPYSSATDALIEQLHCATGCSIRYARSIEEGLAKLIQRDPIFDLILYTVEGDPEGAWRIPQRIGVAVERIVIPSPNLIALAAKPLPLPHAAKCRDRQVDYLLRDATYQIAETSRVILWKRRTYKNGPTIRIEYRNGHHRFALCGSTSSEEICVGTQLGRMLCILARGLKAYTVAMLAEELGIAPQSVKKYMRELRLAYDAVRHAMSIVQPGEEVFWMERGAGGTLCGLRANPVWL